MDKTRSNLITDGWTFGSVALCRGCQQKIEWWTTTKKNLIPADPMPAADSPFISHFATCPKAATFRSKK